MRKTIGNPLSWAVSSIGSGWEYANSVRESVGTHGGTDAPAVRQISVADLRLALRKGIADMGAFRSDVVFACLLYPVIGAVLAAIALKGNMAHLLFPALSGFALVGPLASVGLYEMSRRRELGEPVNWLVLGDVFRSPRFASILLLGLLLLGIFGVWLMTANVIYELTLGPEAPSSTMVFFQEVVSTPAGWAMALAGTAVGFLFAAVVLAISVVSFPLLLDRNVGLVMAVVTSINVARLNPRTVAIWGLIVAVSLAIGSLPLLLGLLLVMPILGHASWHLYRAAVV